ncbi:transposase [Chryseobacterium indologenes]|uniref:transposase n=1 Tax=Chryseobacterium indologenes TaxID=253 RepID=UPI004059C1C4
MNIKNIHIGEMIEERWKDMNISMERTCNFFGRDSLIVLEMFTQRSIDCEVLLKWCKLLEYDFFRLYSQHLILYSPPSSVNNKKEDKKTTLPQFRKNLYTRQIIDFVLELISTGSKTKSQIIEEYRIPKSTLYKWINKYGK